MWYYNLNNKPAGPVDESTLLHLLQIGVITTRTLIWKEGLATWVELSQTGLIQPPAPTSTWQQTTPLQAFQQPVTPQPFNSFQQEQVNQPQPSPVTQNPVQVSSPAQPGQGNYQQFQSYSQTAYNYAKNKPSGVTGIYIAWIIVFGLNFLITNFAFYIEALYQIYQVVNVTIYVLDIAAAILLLIFFGKCWRIVQDGYASTTVGRAIGYLFIPIFGYIWLFKAYHGLAKDLNQFIDRHFDIAKGPQPRKSTPWFSLVFCIVYLINYLYIFSWQVIVRTVIINSSYDEIMPLLRINSVAGLVVSIVFTGISILTLTDYLITARNILKSMQNTQVLPV